ncbi:unnamed protein product [Candida verbasci]|uniref:Golgi to ER traffic protein 1 n=1 Tax=Candida verbasci TaxID=1227364 RepID=A0A9W4TSW5_9ASCO|nr:unnamed protein product [Candida verbasci]
MLSVLSVDLNPYTITLAIFIILLIQKIISFIGKSKLQQFIWGQYLKFSSNSTIKQFNDKQLELKETNRMKKSISAQDEYAKWTKLNRKSDQLNIEIQQLGTEIQSLKTSIDKASNLAIMVVTTLPIWYARIFYRKKVLFYFGNGILPDYIEWVLSLPFGLKGSIGLTIWMFAVNSLLSSWIFLITFPFENKVEKPIEPKETKKTE